jgi:hypothetical protein
MVFNRRRKAQVAWKYVVGAVIAAVLIFVIMMIARRQHGSAGGILGLLFP